MPETERLPFAPVTPEDYEKLYPYTSAYGENSCQHSPVSMFSLSEKYGDAVCVQECFLYTHRERLDDEQHRVYLAPMGEGSRKTAYERILADANTHGKKVRFVTLTEEQAAFVEHAFPGRFRFQGVRDLAEYIFNVQTMAEFPGKLNARRRTEIRSFWRDNRTYAAVQDMSEADIDEVLAFAELWFHENAETHDRQALDREMRSIRKQLQYFHLLRLSGTVLRINGSIKGFCYGTPLNRQCYDVLIEKGARDIPGVYRVLRQESTRRNAAGFLYINFEEDVGVPGLRKIKTSYGPAFLIQKYIVTEQ